VSLRFYRRLRLFPGVSVNLSKSGASMSFGVRGAHYTVGPRGRRVTVGLPGTGLYYTATDPARGAVRSATRSQPVSLRTPAAGVRTPLAAARSRPAAVQTQPATVAPQLAAADRLRPGFFRRLVTPPEERRFVDGLRALAEGREDEAFALLSTAVDLPDGALLAGALALKRGLLPQAERNVRAAIDHADRLGAVLARYGVSSTLSMQITDELTAHVPHTREGALLVLVEILQKQGRRDEALRTLNEIRGTSPRDPVVLASTCELLLDGATDGEHRQVVTLTDGVQNLTPVHTVLLLFRARALRRLKLPDAAAQAATAGLARRVGRSDELRHELRYERALAYGEAGDARRSRAELERIFAEDSTYADVAQRLGMIAPSATTSPRRAPPTGP